MLFRSGREFYSSYPQVGLAIKTYQSDIFNNWINTERKEGVLPEYDCRTDRFEIAIDAMDVIQKSAMAKRMNRVQQNEPKDGGAEPIQATT